MNGIVHPDHIWANTGARVGDHLILTKGLGTGTLTAALKRGALTEDELRPAIESMAQLNNAIDQLAPLGLEKAVHAATDITGFGFSGHMMQMAKASRVHFVIHAAALPRLPRAIEFIEKDFLTKAHRTNRTYTQGAVLTVGLLPAEELLLHDPQTSGGLLLSVDPGRSAAVLAALKSEFPLSAVIGEATAARDVSATIS